MKETEKVKLYVSFRKDFSEEMLKSVDVLMSGFKSLGLDLDTARVCSMVRILTASICRFRYDGKREADAAELSDLTIFFAIKQSAAQYRIIRATQMEIDAKGFRVVLIPMKSEEVYLIE